MRAPLETRAFLHDRLGRDRMGVLAHLVFTQVDSDTFPVEQVQAHAARYFGGSFEVLPAAGAERSESSPADATPVRCTVRGQSATFAVSVRRVTTDDLAAAARAEARGEAFGMAALAARCSHVWRVEAPRGSEPWVLLECCALLASAALGPILPPDEDTLLGVRSARERAEKLRNLV